MYVTEEVKQKPRTELPASHNHKREERQWDDEEVGEKIEEKRKKEDYY